MAKNEKISIHNINVSEVFRLNFDILLTSFKVVCTNTSDFL